MIIHIKFLIEDLYEVSRVTSGNVNLNLVNIDVDGDLFRAIITFKK